MRTAYLLSVNSLSSLFTIKMLTATRNHRGAEAAYIQRKVCPRYRRVVQRRCWGAAFGVKYAV